MESTKLSSDTSRNQSWHFNFFFLRISGTHVKLCADLRPAVHLNTLVFITFTILVTVIQSFFCTSFVKKTTFSSPLGAILKDVREGPRPVAQLVEHRVVVREVVSSTPAGPTLRVFKALITWDRYELWPVRLRPVRLSLHEPGLKVWSDYMRSAWMFTWNM